MRDYLRTLAQDVPDWLMQVNQDSTFSRTDFFNSRVVFYPGSGNDGQPVSIFGGTRSAHCFVYADYGMAKSTLERNLHETSFKGYHNVARLNVAQDEIVPHGWTQHLNSDRQGRAIYQFAREIGNPFAFLEVLERNEDLDDQHGAKRLCILFIMADGVAAFDAMFCQVHSAPLFALVLQDHGFGGNYTCFGAGGLMDEIASRANSQPEYLLCADNTNPWNGYLKIPNSVSEYAAPSGNSRSLYRGGEKLKC